MICGEREQARRSAVRGRAGAVWGERQRTGRADEDIGPYGEVWRAGAMDVRDVASAVPYGGAGW